MFSKINFQDYAVKRKNFYNEFSKFSIDQTQISEPITIDSLFINRINKHLKIFLDRRLEKTKFTHAENREYKNLIKEYCPEVLPVFEHGGPTIYWFKINHLNSSNNEAIINQYYSIKKNGSGWWSKVNPAQKNSITEILYLGKIESGFENRFIQHIGLGHDFTTALKLQRWMPNDVTFTFQFLKLEQSMKPFLEDIEKVLWDECKPLLGAAPRIKN